MLPTIGRIILLLLGVLIIQPGWTLQTRIRRDYGRISAQPPPRDPTFYQRPSLDYDYDCDYEDGSDCSQEFFSQDPPEYNAGGYGQEEMRQPEFSPAADDLCQPEIITSTRLVPSTIFSTRVMGIPTTVYREVTQTKFYPTTTVVEVTVTDVPLPVVQTTTEVLRNPTFLTRAEYFTETAYETVTRFKFLTETSYEVRTQHSTYTKTKYKVKTRYETNTETRYRTVSLTQTRVQQLTQIQQVPHYLTQTLTTKYPIYQTVTNTKYHTHFKTITSQLQADPQVIYQTVYKTQYQPQYVTHTRTQNQNYPVYHTVTSTQVQYQHYTVTKVTPGQCAPPVQANKYH